MNGARDATVKKTFEVYTIADESLYSGCEDGFVVLGALLSSLQMNWNHLLSLALCTNLLAKQQSYLRQLPHFLLRVRSEFVVARFCVSMWSHCM